MEAIVASRLSDLSPDRPIDPTASELLAALRDYATGKGQTPASLDLQHAQQELDAAIAAGDAPEVEIKLAEERLWEAEENWRRERSVGMHRLFFAVDVGFDEALYEFKRVATWNEVQRTHAAPGQNIASRSTMQYRIGRHEDRCGRKWDQP